MKLKEADYVISNTIKVVFLEKNRKLWFRFRCKVNASYIMKGKKPSAVFFPLEQYADQLNQKNIGFVSKVVNNKTMEVKKTDQKQQRKLEAPLQEFMS